MDRIDYYLLDGTGPEGQDILAMPLPRLSPAVNGGYLNAVASSPHSATGVLLRCILIFRDSIAPTTMSLAGDDCLDEQGLGLTLWESVVVTAGGAPDQRSRVTRLHFMFGLIPAFGQWAGINIDYEWKPSHDKA